MNKCESCGKEFDYEPITPSADPYAPGLCYECLPDNVKEAYDEFCEIMAKADTDQSWIS